MKPNPSIERTFPGKPGHASHAKRWAATLKDRSMSRYDGKPFLRLLDSYVLDAISQLPDQQREGLAIMEPKLQSVYNSSASWQEIVRTQMHLPQSFPQSIRRMWDGYLGAAKSQGQSVHPNEFVERFVDENFP